MTKRNFWQIHLSTAIVLMFVTGGIIGLNLRDRKVEDSIVNGWPLDFRERPLDPRDKWIDYYRLGPSDRKLYAAIDIIASITIIGATLIGCEYPIRRREQDRAGKISS